MQTVDLSGPCGNAFYLLGLAEDLAKQLDWDAEVILADMKSGDYEHLLDVFQENFGAVIAFQGLDDEYSDRS